MKLMLLSVMVYMTIASLWVAADEQAGDSHNELRAKTQASFDIIESETKNLVGKLAEYEEKERRRALLEEMTEFGMIYLHF